MNHTVTITLCAPTQTWRTPRWGEIYPTNSWPTKSGIIGLICNTMGIDRSDDTTTQRLAQTTLTIQAHSLGHLLADFHTALHVPNTEGTGHRGIITTRQYVHDACYHAHLTDSDIKLIDQIHNAINQPQRSPYLGTKNCPTNDTFKATTSSKSITDIINHTGCTFHSNNRDVIIAEGTWQNHTSVMVDQPISFNPIHQAPRPINVHMRPNVAAISRD